MTDIAAIWKEPVSPPTRGWTAGEILRVVPGLGFPAHAGMDPAPSACRGVAARFPRPRGDGPWSAEASHCVVPVSPPTRGWTRRVWSTLRLVEGFPAHAGMDPINRVPTGCLSRFPRPRGDGPTGAALRDEIQGVSPPTRGWTHQDTERGKLLLGFPAHAGMDPIPTRSIGNSRRFPRPRGDGPECNATRASAKEVSPPTRGWTARDPARRRPARGFPAHAGMDPPPSCAPAQRRRFPRPRGDGPDQPREYPDARPVSPPTRGWIRQTASGSASGSGFPAHAGMDPRAAERFQSRPRFPRPRGDGPPSLGTIKSVA